MSTLHKCLCCYRKLPGNHYAERATVCHTCRVFHIEDAVTTARSNLNLEWQARTGTKAGRRAVRRERLHAKLAESGKRCTSCHHHKAPDAYHACESRLDGLQPECKACLKLRSGLLAAPGAGRLTWYAVRDVLRSKAAA